MCWKRRHKFFCCLFLPILVIYSAFLPAYFLDLQCLNFRALLIMISCPNAWFRSTVLLVEKEFPVEFSSSENIPTCVRTACFCVSLPFDHALPCLWMTTLYSYYHRQERSFNYFRAPTDGQNNYFNYRALAFKSLG